MPICFTNFHPNPLPLPPPHAFGSAATSSSAALFSGNTTTLVLHHKLLLVLGGQRQRQRQSSSSSSSNEFRWTKLISHKIECGQCRDALQMYEEMRDAGARASSYTFVAALKACGSLRDLQTGKRIHAHILESGIESHTFVATALLHMYAKCGSMEDAWRVFEKMPFRDVVCWNAIILGFAHMHRGDLALQLFDHMQHQGFAADARTFVAALKACTSLAAEEEKEGGKIVKSLKLGKAIHTEAAHKGFVSNTFVANTLVDMYAKCGSMEDARQVFDMIPHPNVVTWNAIILGYAEMEEGKLGLQLFALMQHEGIAPDTGTFVAALKACTSLTSQVDEQGKQVDGRIAKLGCLKMGKTIHTQVVERGFISDVVVANTLVDMYAKCGSMEDAHHVFNTMPFHDVVSWNVMILGYAQLDEGELALQLFDLMQHEAGITPDTRTFVGALKACGSLAAREVGMQVNGKLVKLESLKIGKGIHFQVSVRGYISDLFVANTLVDLYAKCGSMEDARHVFDMMPFRNVVSWNAMILGYAQVEEGELSLLLFARMQHEGVKPNDLTFVGALKACGSMAALEDGRQIHKKICSIGFEHDTIIANSLLDMYGKCGSMDDAQQLFDALHRRDIVAWNALITGHSRQGDSERVFNLFHKMHQEGVEPDNITFLSILNVCTHKGLVDEGQMYFYTMTADYSISPTIDHYNCMVDLFGRAGELNEAILLVEKMPFAPNVVIWRTVLGACRKWNNVEIGKHAFECALRLEYG